MATASVAPTELKVGDAVAHSDPYMVAYNYHGTVKEVARDEVLICWAERQGKPALHNNNMNGG